MGFREFLESLPERLQRGADVKTVFGEPIPAQGKTIVPVARVGYGFGGGMARKHAEGAEAAGPDAGGLGGGVGVLPMGVVEVTERDTRFIGFSDNRRLVGSLLLGCCVGYVLGRTLLRHKGGRGITSLLERRS